MPHSPAPAFAHTCGPHDAQLVLVAEAWGANEDMFKCPLVGWSGLEMARILYETGHMATPPPEPMEGSVDSWGLKQWWEKASGVLTTNVFAFRPPDNNLLHPSITGSVAEVRGSPSGALPPLKIGKYLRPEYLGELDRLRTELAAFPRNLVLALGATATWALLGDTRIGRIRGAITETRFGVPEPGRLKVLPTWHPANVIRMWSNRPVVVADCLKARLERDFPEVRRPHRWVHVAPTIDELKQWTARTLSVQKDWNRGLVAYCDTLSVDIETTKGQIESIAFARSPQDAVVVPFVDTTRPGWSYWPDLAQEREAWGCCKALLQSNIAKLFQNGLFDLQYIYNAGIRPRNCAEDTMLLHHAMYPEMTKSLAFLGSVYSNEAPWKLMRGRRQGPGREEFKRDE